MSTLQEIRVLQLFQELYASFPPGKIDESESPDFILNASDKVIGIEVTEVFQDSHEGKSKLKQYSSDSSNFTDQLITLLQPHLNYSFSIGIDFSKFNPIKKVDKKRLLEQTKNYCLLFLRSMENNEHYRLEYEHGLPRELDRIYIYRYDKMERSFNSQPEGGPVANLMQDHIQKILKQKEQKLPIYLACDEYWLLIKEGNYYAGSFEEIQIELPIASSFTKVFLVRMNRHEVVELK